MGISLALAGCATHHGNVVPDTGPTMEQIYQTSQANDTAVSLTTLRQGLADSHLTAASNIAMTRTDANEVNNLFPQFPNPLVTLYVFPHVVGEEQLPVPGYTIPFPLFKEAPFALPAEIPTVRSTSLS